MHLPKTECDDVNNTRIISQLHPALKHELPREQLFFKAYSNNQILKNILRVFHRKQKFKLEIRMSTDISKNK